MRNILLTLTFGLAACSGGGDRADAILALEGDPAAGETVYTDNCASCHGASGLGEDDPDTTGLTGVNLTEAAGETDADAEFVGYILDGVGTMTAFGDTLEDQQIADVLAYLHDGLIQ